MIDTKTLQNLAKTFTVLYVEDEVKLRVSMVQYLEKFFKTVTSAVDGEAGLNLYKKQKYDLVITDIAMPKINGIKMSSSIKKLNPNQDIIVISAFSDSEKVLEAIKIGVDAYMLKPVNSTQMNEILYKVCYKLKEFRENNLYKRHLQELVDSKTSEMKYLQEEKIVNYKHTLYALVDLVEQRDTYTGGHSTRVAKYAKLIAEQMGFDAKICEELYEAAMLHDIGKIAIPDSILLKPGSLNQLEYKLIQEHVNIGYKILKKVPMFKNIANIVKLHHERFDGSGYPDGLKGDEISVYAMIMGVADTFDAMTTRRIYKARMTSEGALEEIQSLSEKTFPKDVVDAAIIALDHIAIDENINQLPISDLEKERFSYFYTDQLTKSYNSNYLDLTLTQNRHDDTFEQIDLMLIHGFSKYNKKHGWEKGDVLLQNISHKLQDIYISSKVFRIHGDDFAILSKEDIDITEFQEFIKDMDITFSKVTIPIRKNEINSLRDLEVFMDKEL